MLYLVKVPKCIQVFYRDCLWQKDRGQKKIYLTFDDGPHPSITDFVLEQLNKYDAKATFFCIGKNVAAYPEVYGRILQNGHSVGNHTYHHLNGRKTAADEYLNDIQKASALIDSDLFRPPYGRFTSIQRKRLKAAPYQMRPVMWTVLSGDFDNRLSPHRCTKNVLQHARNGSIIVFHDSEKAWPRLREALPEVLSFYNSKGYQFESLPYKKGLG